MPHESVWRCEVGKIQTNRRERREKRAELRAELDDYYMESEDD